LVELGLLVAYLELEQVVALRELQELKWVRGFTLQMQEVKHLIDFFLLSLKLKLVRVQDVAFLLQHFAKLLERAICHILYPLACFLRLFFQCIPLILYLVFLTLD